MKKKDIEIMNSIKWWHQIELEPGIFTPNAFKTITTEKTTNMYAMPEDLADKTVLDIGCWDGGFSFEAEKRGAKSVLGIDIWKNRSVADVDGAHFAKRILKSNVEFKELDLYDLSPANHGKFDVVLFYGILYHLNDLYDAMEKISNITNELCILETALIHDKTLLEHKEPLCEWGMWSAGDKYNTWFPNYSFINKIAQDVGFKRIEKAFVHDNKNRGTFKLYK